ncbi:MAG TPA: DUF2087 domain-containing protein [Actinomycetes bacterium]|nr:DUF2087 domain-containing protein [Actinomycetes bacterium]
MSDPTPAMICGLLATAERLRVAAALVLGARTLTEVATAAGLAPKEAAQALARLTGGGLVEATADGGYRLRAEAFADAARSQAEQPMDPGEEYGTGDLQAAAVLRRFVIDGRLVAIPAAAGKRRVVLDHLARAFEPGRRYAEREVDAILRAFCEPSPRARVDPSGTPPDHLSLRRYLVDGGFMAREHGIYWRTGGTVDLG